MKKIINIYLLFIAAAFCNFSCDDIIEAEPESIITVNSFWNSEDDAVGGLYGMYSQFRVFMRANIVLLGEARSEVMGDGLQNADYRIKYFENTLTETNADLHWQSMYRVISFANLIIKYVPDIPFNVDSDKNDILAQAYTMRAYMYFLLAKTWGDVPLITEPTEGFDAETTFQERRPVSEVFQLIKSDIDQANGLFSSNEFNENRSLWSKPALNVLKGDVYLWTGKVLGGGQSDFTTALNALNEAENSQVSLLDDFSQIFDYDNKGNEEVMFVVHFEDIEYTTSTYFADMYIGANDIRSTVDQETRDIIGAAGGLNWWAPTELVRNQFHPDDQRRDASFLEVYAQEGGQPAYITTIVLKGQGIVDGGVRKFLDDIVVYRYADLLLLKAEAKNALGQDPSGEMNQIRQRAYGDQFSNFEFENGSQIENDEAILQERLLEFAFESKRWWDLVRFDKAFELVPSLQGKSSERHLLLWPVTLQTISLNSKVTQTAGY